MSVVQVEEWRPWALLLRENNDFPCLLNAFSHGMFIVSDRYLRQASLKSCINCPICHSEDSTSFNTPISICLETPLLVKDWLIRTLIIASNFDLCRRDFQNHYCHYEYFIHQVLRNLPTIGKSVHNKGWSGPWVAMREGASPHNTVHYHYRVRYLDMFLFICRLLVLQSFAVYISRALWYKSLTFDSKAISLIDSQPQSFPSAEPAGINILDVDWLGAIRAIHHFTLLSKLTSRSAHRPIAAGHRQ